MNDEISIEIEVDDEIEIDLRSNDHIEIDISDAQLVAFVRQVDMSVDDEKSLAFIKNRSTKYLKNEGADGQSRYATEEYVKQNGGKIDSISLNGDPINIDENKNVNIILPDSYSKKEIDEKVKDVMKTTEKYIFDGGNSLGEIDE